MNNSGYLEYECEINYQTCPDYHIATSLLKICPVILIVVGTFGNILSIVILLRPTIRKSVCSVYLIALSVSDLLVLYTGLLRQWIYKTFDVDIRDIGSTACKFHTGIVYFSLQLSSWILVALTTERTFLVWFPRETKARYTKKVAVISLVIIAVCLLILNSHTLYGLDMQYVEIINGSTLYTCYLASLSYKAFWTSTWPWIDLSIFCVVPFCCLLIGNTLIFVKVMCSRRAANRQVSISTIETRHQRSKFYSLSITLMVINSTFLICNIPICVFMIVRQTWIHNLNEEQRAEMHLVWSIVNILMYSNNSINFFLYILSGRRFRNELVCVLQLIKKKALVLFTTKPKKARRTVSVKYTNNTDGLCVPHSHNESQT